MYSGTALVTNPTSEQINRAILDLLKKINELVVMVENLEKKQNETQNN
jgi:hypothetical protein